jgi:hypothetical protein
MGSDADKRRAESHLGRCSQRNHKTLQASVKVRFTYIYKTSGGVRTEAKITADTREQVFAQLRSQGIRPIKVIAEDGSKANGEPPRQSRKHKVVIAILSLALLGLSVYITFFGDLTSTEVQTLDGGKHISRGIESNIIGINPGVRVAKPRPRKQLALKGIVDLEKAFKYRAEVALAQFACPGATNGIDAVAVAADFTSDIYDAVDDIILLSPEDSPEIIDIKRIVAGIKVEAAMMLDTGKSVEELVEWLISRQRMEADFRARIAESVSRGADIKQANLQLQSMGMKELK